MAKTQIAVSKNAKKNAKETTKGKKPSQAIPDGYHIIPAGWPNAGKLRKNTTHDVYGASAGVGREDAKGIPSLKGCRIDYVEGRYYISLPGDSEKWMLTRFVNACGYLWHASGNDERYSKRNVETFLAANGMPGISRNTLNSQHNSGRHSAYTPAERKAHEAKTNRKWQDAMPHGQTSPEDAKRLKKCIDSYMGKIAGK